MPCKIENFHVLTVTDPVPLKERDRGMIGGRAFSNDAKNLASEIIDVLDVGFGINSKAIG